MMPVNILKKKLRKLLTINRKILSEPLDYLELKKETINLLNSNNINNIEDLWKTSRIKLKQISLTQDEIKEIIIKLQLHGLDLNKKIYN